MCKFLASDKSNPLSKSHDEEAMATGIAQDEANAKGTKCHQL